MIPFMAEDIYQNLVMSVDKSAPKSVHLCDFPIPVAAHMDAELESSMDEVLKIVVLGRAARNGANIKNRQPIGKMYVKAEKELSEFFVEIIEDELNIKTVEFKDDVASFTSYSFKPQLKTVGPKYGKQLGGIREYLSNIDGNKAMSELKADGAIKFQVNDTEIALAEEDLLIEVAQMDGFASEADNNITVVLDTNLTPELIEEGFVREIISKIQTMRKEADFDVTDKINVYADNNDAIFKILENNTEDIKRDVLAEQIIIGEVQGFVKDWNINGEKVTMGVTKISL